MADDEEILDDEGEEDELNWMVIIIAAVITLVLIGGLIWWFLIREKPEGPVEPDYVVPDSLFVEEVYLDMPELFINPLDSRGRFFLILKFDIAYNNKDKVFDEMLLKPWNWAKAKNMINTT